MRIWRSIEEVEPARQGRAVAIGTFDGVHLGHRAVIGQAREWAATHNVPSCVVTFEPHPVAVLRPEAAPDLLTPLAVKQDLIAALGIDELLVVSFDRAFSEHSAEWFAEEVLAGRLGARWVAIGDNFHFGHGARGNAAFLTERAPEFGFETHPVGLVQVGGEPVSSSRIRALVTSGEVAQAAKLLGDPFQLEGEVVEGDRRGRDLGVPTANIVPAPEICLPANGVYAAMAEVDGERHAAATNVGVRPTFDSDRGILVEPHLLGFDGDLYGRRLRVAFLERLRDEERFESEAELVDQIQRDVEATRRVFASVTQA